MAVPHLPVLRAGRPYRSLDRATLPHVATGLPVVEVSQANPGLIARDLGRQGEHRRALEERSAAELFALGRRAAELFTGADLPLDPEAGTTQSFTDYLRQVSATTGSPQAMVRMHSEKVHFVLSSLERIVAGLTRGLDPAVLDRGYGVEGERPVSYRRNADALGVILPSNSPGVHALWLPAIALKTPLVLKPGAREPWTPYRVAQALAAAGAPPGACSFYPTDHAGATQVLLATGRSMLFGDQRTVRAWARDPRVEIHGPGWSKVVLGPDQRDRWADHLPLLAESVAAGGGRSCINASGVWLPRGLRPQGRELAAALARELAALEPRPLDDPGAVLAAWSDPQAARRVSELLDRLLQTPGAHDLSRSVRGPERLVTAHGLTFLLPTVVWCEDPDHPLAQMELLFPFAAVVEVPEEELLDRLGSSLVVSGVSDDPAFRAGLLACPTIDRLNLGPIPTTQVSWDQPHEGNLFDHLWERRAFQGPLPVPAAAATPEALR
jgi:hypothetical protein